MQERVSAGWRAAVLATLASLSGAVAAAGPAAQGDLNARLQLCTSCHGEGGNSQVAGTPSIAGQPKTFLETQLILFREGVRDSPQMQPVTKGLADRDITAIAEHFAGSPAKPASGPVDKALFIRGRAAAQKLRCGVCHLPDFRGREQIPRLAGQREDYLVESMIAFRDNRRSGADTQMIAVLYGVSDADIKAMAHFLARFPSPL